MSIKKNIIANFAGSAWSALMGLAFIPFYIRLMGAEAYGIVGVFVSIQIMFSVLDLGLSQALSREMARLSVDRKNADLMADMARTLEIVYWGIALGVAALIAMLSDYIAYHWLNPEHLSRESLVEALWVIAVVVGLRWPIALYMGGLNGLQRQVMVNGLLAVFVTLQGAGALAVLSLVEPTIHAFFMWQAIMALLQVLVLRSALWRSLPSEGDGTFRIEVFKGVWRFAAGMTGISLLVTILTQVDKVLLSKLLPLAEFGYYTFAATAAAIVYKLIAPIFTAYYPLFTELASKDDQPSLARAYHQGCQLMAVAILPATLVLSFFSKQILELWTNNPDIVAHSSLLISLLVIGNALNGLMNLPYALQLAHGWTKLAFYQNIIAVIVLVPAIYFSTLRWGAVGAAGVWIILNSGYLLISVQVMHRRLLTVEKSRWYVDDVGKILLSVLVVTGIGRVLMVGGLGGIAKITILVITLTIATIAAIVNAKTLRECFPFKYFLGAR